MSFGANALAPLRAPRHGGAHKGYSMKSKSFLDPLFVRIGIVIICAVWAVIEYGADQIGWAAIAAGACAYGVWSLLISYRPKG
jgi:hypothetical protein